MSILVNPPEEGIERLQGHDLRRHVQLHRGRLDHRDRRQPHAVAGGFGVDDFAVGLLAAISANAFGAAAGALSAAGCATATAASSSTPTTCCSTWSASSSRRRGQLRDAAGWLPAHRPRRRRGRAGVVDVHRGGGARRGARPACRHRPARLVDRPDGRVRAGHRRRAARPAGQPADLRAPVRRRVRDLVAAPGAARVGAWTEHQAEHARTGPTARGFRELLTHARNVTALLFLLRRLRLLEPRRRPGRASSCRACTRPPGFPAPPVRTPCRCWSGAAPRSRPGSASCASPTG